MLTETEYEAVTEACRRITLTSNVYVNEGVVSALLETVLDYQMQTTTVERAMQHFQSERSVKIETFAELAELVESFPDTEEGNVELARHLWGYRLWTRARQLRGLLSFFQERGLTTLSDMQRWAAKAQFEENFEGRVKGLGPAVFRWLVMRLGVETVKPDVHVIRFVSRAVGRPVNEVEAVEGVEEAARRIGVSARVLDWSVWEHARGA